MRPGDIPASETWRIGVDIGGTFTDLVLSSSSGKLDVHKVPTVVEDPSQGAMNAIALAAQGRGLSESELLRRCSLFVHGSTIATNTLLEGKGAKVGMLATSGFRDAIEIRRGVRDNPWDHRTPYSPVLVPRYLRRPVRGRIDRNGQAVEPLCEEDILQAIELFEAEGVESIAVCLFNSFLNADHERRVEELLRASLPSAMVSLSSAIAPIMGEYERGITAVLNAYVAPRTLRYLRAMNRGLVERGLEAPFVLIQSNGGAVSVSELGEKSVALLLSGPAAGVGALRYYAPAIGSSNLVSMEIGGTSCDVILMENGTASFTDMLGIGGYHCAIPSVDVHTVGAGGGTLAHVDASGLIHIGPQGAGAYPGPACYGRGGEEPTVTDAQVVLGRLKPGKYAGGSVIIDGALATSAVEKGVAKPLNIPVDAAAAGMIQLMEQKLLHAVERVSTERGHRPEHLTLVAGGGAGPLHAVSVAKALNCRQVYVPRLSGAFCALGMLNANLQHDYMRVFLGRLDSVDRGAMDAVFAEMEREARRTLEREGFGADDIRLSRMLDLRYIGQQWDVTVDADIDFNGALCRAAFEKAHDRLFGHTQPDGIVEITKLRLRGVGLISPLPYHEDTGRSGTAAPRETRPVWMNREAGWRDTAVFGGTDLAPGNTIRGPAIIDELTTTIMIEDGDMLRVDAGGNYLIELGAGAR
jgi:N-methylhydantoinase A